MHLKCQIPASSLPATAAQLARTEVRCPPARPQPRTARGRPGPRQLSVRPPPAPGTAPARRSPAAGSRAAPCSRPPGRAGPGLAAGLRRGRQAGLGRSRLGGPGGAALARARQRRPPCAPRGRSRGQRGGRAGAGWLLRALRPGTASPVRTAPRGAARRAGRGPGGQLPSREEAAFLGPQPKRRRAGGRRAPRGGAGGARLPYGRTTDRSPRRAGWAASAAAGSARGQLSPAARRRAGPPGGWRPPPPPPPLPLPLPGDGARGTPRGSARGGRRGKPAVRSRRKLTNGLRPAGWGPLFTLNWLTYGRFATASTRRGPFPCVKPADADAPLAILAALSTYGGSRSLFGVSVGLMFVRLHDTAAG